MLKKYLLSYIKLPWSILFLINIVCFSILAVAYKVICPDYGVCAKDVIQTFNLNNEKAYMTVVSYFGFYFFGIFFAHAYSFYSEEKGNILNAKLAKTLAFFLVVILLVFTCAIAYVYLSSGGQVV
ncbi:MAG: hypothetical protein ACRCXZ_08715 [Patescibacteria group bacterium]